MNQWPPNQQSRMPPSANRGMGNPQQQQQQQQHGMYRQAPLVPALPLPRTKWMGVFTALAFLVAIVGTVVVFAAFSSGGVAQHWRAIKEGGPGMFALLFLAGILPITSAVFAMMLARGKALSFAGVLAALGVLPIVVGSVLAFLYAHRIGRIVVDAHGSLLARIVAEGISELSNLHALGDLAASLSCMIVAIGAASAVGSIDVNRVSLLSRTGLAKNGHLVNLAVALAWLFVVVGLILINFRNRRVTILTPVELLTIIVAGLLFIMLARSATALRDCLDADEAKKHAGLIVVATVTIIMALCFLERADVARGDVRAFGAIAAESVDASQRARILAEVIPMHAYASYATAIHIVFGVICGVIALLPAIGTSRAKTGIPVYPITTGSVIAIAAVVFALGSLGLSGMGRNQLIASVKSSYDAETGGVALPRLNRIMADYNSRDARDEGTETVAIPLGGKGVKWSARPSFGKGDAKAQRESLVDAAADANVPFSAVIDAIRAKPAYVNKRFLLLARDNGFWVTEPRVTLGDLTPLVESDLIRLPFVVSTQETSASATDRAYGYAPIEATLTGKTLTVKSSVGKAVTVDISTPMPNSFRSVDALSAVQMGRATGMHLAVQSTASVTDVATALLLLEDAFKRSSLGGYSGSGSQGQGDRTRSPYVLITTL